MNELAPAPKELAVVEEDPSEHVLPISELTPEVERGLRYRYVGEQEAVQMEIGRLGALYRRGRVFPYPPEWTDGTTQEPTFKLCIASFLPGARTEDGKAGGFDSPFPAQNATQIREDGQCDPG